MPNAISTLFLGFGNEINAYLYKKSDMKRSVFNKALDSFNEYMANQGCYLFDPPVQEFSSEEEGYVLLGNRNSSFGRYEIETGVFIPDGEDESPE